MSTVLLLYGVANNVIPFSILMVFGVSLGGFISMSGLTVLAIKTRETVMKYSRKAEQLAEILEMAGLGFLILVAAVLIATAI